MALSQLVKNQTIRIDDESRGNGEPTCFYDKRKNVHLHKITNYKNYNVGIKIPINSDRPLDVKNNGARKGDAIPTKLRKEIQTALNNPDILNPFIKDIEGVIKNFGVPLGSIETTRKILQRLAKHFDLTIVPGEKVKYNPEGKQPLLHVNLRIPISTLISQVLHPKNGYWGK